MKAMLHLIAWTFAALVLVYVAVGPGGALHGNALACLGVGLIGLGVLLETRRHRLRLRCRCR